MGVPASAAQGQVTISRIGHGVKREGELLELLYIPLVTTTSSPELSRVSLVNQVDWPLNQIVVVQAIYQRSRTTVSGNPSERYPCLVDFRELTWVEQVWATDITDIPLQKGFLYLVAIIDLHSRHVLSWKLSNSLDTEFCLEALEMALSSGRRRQIFHSDQGCQFTSTDFVAWLQAEEIEISWSGRKRCYDNILVERLWRTLKDEEVYRRAYSNGWEAEISLARFLWRYCHVRPPSALGGKTPYDVYTETEPSSSCPELKI